ncbi:GntR family transcriptional regulator [Neobacillus cucumis]|uniref:GntR family transcriptional regulator n=1 Tax=Neobacillus cucumis TaxID=1740721 RepID=UPI001963082E|nr:GntR family transcriptional regulator [Neobacillus cucumis]MBM7654915.1 GntR family transcriptional regulator [Neobacillus cucumis]MED4227557.1 GntR family transcriptional regulator [Neobacillus cucumis]
MINKNSPIPIYYQLEELIKVLIEKGELKPGDALPPEREYAEKYHISRMTVRQAFTDLVNEGYLYRQQGKGTFVAERKIEQGLQGLTSFTEDMIARGLKPGSKLVKFEMIPASSQIAGQLKIAEYGPVYEISRIRLADDVPMALETNYISANLIKGITEDIVNESLYAYIEGKLNLRIASASQTIESSVASQSEANYLNIKMGDPVLLIQRNTFLLDGTPLELVRSVYRADRYKFMIQMKR